MHALVVEFNISSNDVIKFGFGEFQVDVVGGGGHHAGSICLSAITVGVEHATGRKKNPRRRFFFAVQSFFCSKLDWDRADPRIVEVTVEVNRFHHGGLNHRGQGLVLAAGNCLKLRIAQLSVFQHFSIHLTSPVSIPDGTITSVVSTMTHQRGLHCYLWNRLACGTVIAVTKMLKGNEQPSS